jgi:hypothetical protein
MHLAAVRPLFLGLPGAGKSTVAEEVSRLTGVSVVATDPLFRIFRALPASSIDQRADVMRSFLGRAATLYPRHYARLLDAALRVDGEGRCALHDGKYFRSFGEEVFRLFEIEMLKWLESHGEFADRIVDLSASAPLYAENRMLFSLKNGYLPILLDTPRTQIVDNLIVDFGRYQQDTSKGEIRSIRGAYEAAACRALRSSGNVGLAEREAILKSTFGTITDAERSRRMPFYQVFALRTLVPAPREGVDQIAHRAIILVESVAIID